jgi:hypothetical protein
MTEDTKIIAFSARLFTALLLQLHFGKSCKVLFMGQRSPMRWSRGAIGAVVEEVVVEGGGCQNFMERVQTVIQLE